MLTLDVLSPDDPGCAFSRGHDLAKAIDYVLKRWAVPIIFSMMLVHASERRMNPRTRSRIACSIFCDGTTAILDRLLHRRHGLTIQGNSYRLL
jgi:hypothetical protein